MKSLNKLCLSLMVMLGFSTLLTSCGKDSTSFVNEQIYSIKLQYNGKNIENQVLRINKAEQTKITLKAKIMKDAAYTPTVNYSSSVESVASISSTGEVSIKNVGETIISASVKEMTDEIVLIVTDSLTSVLEHSINVIGGKAFNSSGVEVTTAQSGDYLTLVSNEEKHKEFNNWSFNNEEIWQNGNLIKMPNEDLTVTATYVDTLYQLNLVNAKVIKADDIDNPDPTNKIDGDSNQYTYGFKYGTQITIRANDDKENEMFVGYDQNIVDNRIGNEGERDYTFIMKGEETTLTAVYSPLTKNILLPKSYSDFVTTDGFNKASTIKLTNPIDPDLEGLYGYKLSINGNANVTEGYPENMSDSALNTLTDFEPKTLKVKLKNESMTLPITVEVYASYHGNMLTTGNVTIEPNSVVSKFLHANICIANGCSWGIAIREKCSGDSNETIPLNVVIGAANTYPNGNPSKKNNENIDFLNFGDAAIEKQGDLSKTGNWTASKRTEYYDQYGAIFWSAYAENIRTKWEYCYTKIANFKKFADGKETINIYTKFENLVNNIDKPINTFTIYVMDGQRDPDAYMDKRIATKEFKLEYPNEVQLGKIEVTVPEVVGDIYIVVAKTTLDGSGKYCYNTFMQFAYSNSFGYVD